jgi:hypothetical protein
MTYDYTDSAYDQLLKDAARDNRVGDHLFMVTDVLHETWPSGDPRLKFKGVLQTANNAKADFQMSPPPPPDVVAAQYAGWDKKKQQAVASSVTLGRQLQQHYGKKPDDIQQGDVFAVKTAKTKIDADGKGGFIRIISFLPKERLSAGATAAAADAPPF